MGARTRESNVPAIEDSASAHGSTLPDTTVRPRKPRFRGSRTVTAMLPNGRTAWLHFQPAPVPISEVNRLASAVDDADARHTRALRSTSQAIAELSRTVSRDVANVTKARVEGAGSLTKRLAESDAKLEARVEAESRRQSGALEKDWRELQVLTRRLRRRSIWDHVVVASALPLFATYGRRGNPFAANNVTLALSLGVWLVGDEISDLISEGGDKRSGPSGELDLWSYLAPLGNLLTGWWLLDGTHRQRIVTGIASDFERPRPVLALVLPAREAARPHLGAVVIDAFREIVEEIRFSGGDSGAPRPGGPPDLARPQRTLTYVATVDLAAHIGQDHLAELVSFTNVPAIASLVSARLKPELSKATFSVRSIQAVVGGQFLHLTAVVEYRPTRPAPEPRETIFSDFSVAWAVDTKKPER
jgi:hypothetical protein